MCSWEHFVYTELKTKETLFQDQYFEKRKELTVLLRMTSTIANGGEVDILDIIGNHEYSCLMRMAQYAEEQNQVY